ncbi:MAG: hypothetical protein DMF96_10015 [Acidobacteria bacterium]|nr:MAG: hypothetical protein DMF96_10015 [Acidobacteriota bacterium]
MIHGTTLMVAALTAAASTAGAQTLSPLRSAPETVTALTIEEAVLQALEHNMSLLAERDNVGVADAALLTASLRPNPVVTAGATRPDQSLIDAGISPYEQIVRTDFVMERGGKRERRIEQAALVKSFAELQLSNTSRLLVLDIERAFTDVQLAKLNLALAEDTLKAFNDVVSVNVERARTGDLSQVELARSRLAALQFQNEVRGQEARLRTARNRLSLLMGRGPGGDAIDTVGELRNAPLQTTDEQLRRLALDARPDLQALRTDRARSVADLRLQLANGKVDYTVAGEYHRQEGSVIRGSSYAFYFSTPLPLFNDISHEVASAYAEYSLARGLVDTIETQMLAPARDVRATTEYAYRRGEATFVELLDAQRAFNETMRSYHEARAQYAQSLYALDALTTRSGRP